MAKSWAHTQPLPAKRRLRADLIEDLESRQMMSTTAHTADVALIDSTLPDYNLLRSAISANSKVIAYDGKHDSAAQVLGKLAAWAAAAKTKIQSLSIVSHGASGEFALGKEFISLTNEHDAEWERLRVHCH